MQRLYRFAVYGLVTGICLSVAGALASLGVMIGALLAGAATKFFGALVALVIFGMLSIGGVITIVESGDELKKIVTNR